MEDGTVDIGIASSIPKGLTPKIVGNIDLKAVVSKHHPLAKLENLTFDNLSDYTQVVIRDAGLRRNTNSGWLGSKQRITVSSLDEALRAVHSNCGFAWLPEWMIEEHGMEALSPLKLKFDSLRTVSLQLGTREECLASKVHCDLISLLLL